MQNESAKHFDFGKNWADYAKTLTPEKLAQAKAGLLALLPAEDWMGKSVLDIGCGSGVHAAAMTHLGIQKLTCVDYDPHSVATTVQVLRGSGQPNVDFSAQQADILSWKTAEKFQIVYSWGVLHHTGNMWKAITNAADLVAPKGKFVIAIYHKTPLCGAWRRVKWLYTYSPLPIKWLLNGFFYVFFYALALIMSGKSPAAGERGMNWWHDVKDWIGGYPYESATPEEITQFTEGLGFRLVRTRHAEPYTASGIAGSGCAEYVFERL
jgi:SAM-dependent methyltransferase